MNTKLARKLRFSRFSSRPNETSAGSGERQTGIDLVRAIGVLAVVLYHYSYRFPADYIHGGTHVNVFAYGKLGVNMFFIVSAFCISGSLDRSQSLVQFLAKRIARLYPAFLMCALTTFLVTMLFGLPGREVGILTLLMNLLWINMILPIPHVDGAYWTIAFELRFYFLIGIVYFIAKRDYRKVINFWRLINLCGIALYVVGYIFKDGIVGQIIRVTNANIFLHPFEGYFLIGITLFRWSKISCASRAINVALFCAGVVFSDNLFDEKIICLAFLPILLLILRSDKVRIPAPVLWIGLISYPLYLLHQNFGLVIMRETWPVINPFIPRSLIAFSIVAATAAIINFRLEPLVRLPFEHALIRLGNVATNWIPGQHKNNDASAI